MTIRITLIVLHAVLLLLASTSFTIVPGLANGGLNCDYYRYVLQSGWGVPYQFPFSLSVVLTYLAAYAIGVAAYGLIWRSGSAILGCIGTLLCAIGFASFAYELTHWFSDHYGSWIVSAPIVLLPLAVVAIFQQSRMRSNRYATP